MFCKTKQICSIEHAVSTENFIESVENITSQAITRTNSRPVYKTLFYMIHEWPLLPRAKASYLIVGYSASRSQLDMLRVMVKGTCFDV